MAVITIANTDWAILDAVTDALAGATVGGSPVFAAVRVTASADQLSWGQGRDSPVAVVEYRTTTESDGVDGERNCRLSVRLHLAAMAVGTGVDEAGRVQEALRLVNAAKNAVESSLPPAAEAVGAARLVARRVEWDEVKLDIESNRPWVIATLGVRFGYVLAAATAH